MQPIRTITGRELQNIRRMECNHPKVHESHENVSSLFFLHIRTMADKCKNIKEAASAYNFRINIEFGIGGAYAILQTYRYLFYDWSENVVLAYK